MSKRLLLAVLGLVLCLHAVDAGFGASEQPSGPLRESRSPAIIAPHEATVAMPSVPGSRERRAGPFDALVLLLGVLVVALSTRTATPGSHARRQTDGFYVRRRGPPLRFVTV